MALVLKTSEVKASVGSNPTPSAHKYNKKMFMENIHARIKHDEKILDDPMISSQSRRHVEEELESLRKYQANHPDDDHDPTSLELFCDSNPDALECRIYED